jgi:hypothetical protein
MTQDVKERGSSMLEQVQQVNDRMEYDPNVLETTGSPADNPDISQVGLSGPELIDLDKITELDDFELKTPPAGSPTYVLVQPETAIASHRNDASNPLRE